MGPGGYIQRRIEQINKASQEGVEAGAGRERDVEKGQAGLWRSQLKMQVCGAWVFWTRGPKEEARPRGKSREVEELGVAVRKGVQHFGGVEAGDLGRAPTKVTGKAADRGLSLSQRVLSLKTARSGPQGGEKGVKRSGGQSWLGKPFQLLVLLQFPHPAERQRRRQKRPADLGG